MRALALLFALAAAAPARAVVVNADGTLPEDEQRKLENPLAGHENQINMTVKAGAEQGFDSPTRFTIGNIKIETVDPNAPAQPKLALPQKDFSTGLIVAALLIVGATLLIRRRPQAAAAPSAGPPNLGETPFAIVKAIGQGGMGTVYEAIDRNLDRKVAVKRLNEGCGAEGDAAYEELLKEAKTVASLHHPNIVDIHAVVNQGGSAYLVFELIEGRTVEDLLLERMRLTMAETYAVLGPVCRALEFAHERGVIHRDLKPANIMITVHGQVKVMDFGIARRLRMQVQPGLAGNAAVNVQLTDHIRGTLPYLSPEAWSGVIRPEVDVYALGIMAYRMLCGDYPYPPDASVEEKIRKEYTALSRRAPGLKAGMDEFIAGALEPDPDARIRTPKDFRERLASLTA